jgi:hypothetical protein
MRIFCSGKVKVVPVNGWTDPEGSWRLGLPDVTAIGARMW